METMDQKSRGERFRTLHQRDRAFIIPNPWDAGTARLLARLGFEALATTSAGYAFSVGRRDTTIGRSEMIEHVGAVASATPLPVSADLENGYATDPRGVAETITLAGAAGVVGASIEDATHAPLEPIHDISVAVERMRAAAEAARALPVPFTLTGRAENYLWGRPDLADTIRRLQAYQEAGADVLYAPGLTTREEIAAVVRSVDRPVNVLMGMRGARLSLAELSDMGVRRVSVGSALCRVALGAMMRAAAEMRENGTFSFADEAIPFDTLSAMFEG
jgi:2-methylisocitrate lyase-like PEP mutase family enzyme